MDKKKVNFGKKIILGLGGSIVCPDKINTAYLKSFYSFLKKKIKQGYKFIIVVGGGDIARKYQKAALETTHVSNTDKDWIGIHATRINAHLLRVLFKKEANPIIFDKRFKLKEFGKYSVIIGSGWKPGWSTDYVATQIAADLKINKIIILTKPDYIYTVDPQKNKNAKPIKKITWQEYLKKIPSKWKPGLHLPIDPIASRLAQKEKMEIVLVNGRKIVNLEKIFSGEKFKGTIIS